MSSNVTKTGQHGSGFLGLPNLYLVAKVQFWQLATGPDLTTGGVFFFKASLPSPNVEQCDHNRSAWVRVPRASQNFTWLQKFNFGNSDRSGPDERRRFFSKQLCLARMSSNVTKTGQHGSGAPRPPKSTLGCKSSNLVIRDRSGPDERRYFFPKLLCLA